ncbi:sodium:solute symporter family transporter, partial [Staphylococcus saprophyticus]
MSQILFHPLLARFLFPPIFPPIMTTISSQFLVTSTSLTQHFYKLIPPHQPPNQHQKQFLLLPPLSLIILPIVSISIPSSPNHTIFPLLPNPSPAFPPPFPPLLLLSLYCNPLSTTPPLTPILSPPILLIISIPFLNPLPHLNHFFNLYQIIPAFLTTLILTVLVSKFTK